MIASDADNATWRKGGHFGSDCSCFPKADTHTHTHVKRTSARWRFDKYTPNNLRSFLQAGVRLKDRLPLFSSCLCNPKHSGLHHSACMGRAPRSFVAFSLFVNACRAWPTSPPTTATAAWARPATRSQRYNHYLPQPPGWFPGRNGGRVIYGDAVKPG